MERTRSRRFVLPEPQRRDLVAAFKQLDWSQKNLSVASGVSQPWVSNLITGRRPVSGRHLVEEVMHALQVRSNTLSAEHRLSEELEQGINSTLDLVRQGARFTEQAKRMATLTGLIPPDRLNFVDRTQVIPELNPKNLLDGASPTYIVGGIRSGISTQLNALAVSTRDFGVKVGKVDFSVFGIDPPSTEKQLAGHRRQMYEHLQDGVIDLFPIHLVPPQNMGIHNFWDWFQRMSEHTGNARRLLMFDGITSLDPKLADELMSLMNLLPFYQTRGSQLDIVGGIGISSIDSMGLLERVKRQVNLPPFNKKEVETLITSLGIPSTKADWIYEELKGQPYLTNIVASRLHINPSSDGRLNERDFFSEAVRRESGFGAYLMQTEKLLVKNGQPTEQLDVFYFISKGFESNPNHPVVELLEAAGLISRNPDKVPQYTPASKFHSSMADYFSARFDTEVEEKE